MDTPGARLRIDIAHGSIRDFGTQGETKNQIAPDRARRLNLDYLALGDWHLRCDRINTTRRVVNAEIITSSKPLGDTMR